MEVSVQLLIPADLPAGKSSRYQFYRRLGRPQCGRSEEEKILFSLPRIELIFLSHPAFSLPLYASELSTV
jgi:hypothetical protein